MGSFIGLLVGRRLFGRIIGEKGARVIAYTLLALLVCLAIGVGKCTYDASVVSKYTADQRRKQAERERKADRNLGEQKQIDDAAAAERKKEIENATRGIPDQAPSPRQRARACVELRREAAANGRPQPSC